MSRNIDDLPDLITPRELSDYLQVAVQTLNHWRMNAGDGPRFIKLGRSVRYRKEAVLEWLDDQGMR